MKKVFNKLVKKAFALSASLSLAAGTLASLPISISAHQYIIFDIPGLSADVKQENGVFKGLDITIDRNQAMSNMNELILDIPAIPVESITAQAPITIHTDFSGNEIWHPSVYIPVVNGGNQTVSVRIDNGSNQVNPYNKVTLPTQWPYKPGNTTQFMQIEIEPNASYYLENRNASFFDVTGPVNQYPADSIAYLVARGIMSGTGNGQFSPAGTVTRGQLAMMMYRLVGQPQDFNNAPFPDGVNSSDFYANAAKWAVANGIMGQGAAFNGNKPITREEVALILCRYSPSPVDGPEYLLDPYVDRNEITNGMAGQQWLAMCYVVERGIMGSGTDHLRPRANITRQEMAAVFKRFMDWNPKR